LRLNKGKEPTVLRTLTAILLTCSIQAADADAYNLGRASVTASVIIDLTDLWQIAKQEDVRQATATMICKHILVYQNLRVRGVVSDADVPGQITQEVVAALLRGKVWEIADIQDDGVRNSVRDAISQCNKLLGEKRGSAPPPPRK
jgi:hypothetical protein